MNRPALLRLAAVAAAALTVLPALPAAAGGPPEGAGRPSAPSVRGLDLACPAERVQGGGFADTAGSVHASAVDCLAFYGVTKGGADGTFGAGKAVTRAQLATFLARVLDDAGVDVPTDAADAFVDDEGSAHEQSLNALAALEIVNGAGDGTVSPEAPVRRDQMASFLVRLLELVTDEELAETLEDYFDDTDGSVHRGPINALAGLGIAAGKAKGLFDPSSEVKREQMATFLMRLIDRLVEKGEVRVPAAVFLSDEKVVPGDVVTGTVVGEGITAVSLAGCGFDDVVATPVTLSPLPDRETATGSATGIPTATDSAGTVVFTFELTVPDAWPAEQDDDADSDEDADSEEDADSDEAAEDESDEQVDGALTVAGDDRGGKDRGPRGVRGDDDEKCEFGVLVTFADGSTEELEAELKLREPADVDEESSDDDEDDELEDEDDELEDDDEDDEDDEDEDDEAPATV